jgi:hypothetical protein
MKVNSSWRIRFIQKLNELLHRRQLLLRDPQPLLASPAAGACPSPCAHSKKQNLCIVHFISAGNPDSYPFNMD